MEKLLLYILRVIGTILLSFAITLALGVLAVDVICHAYSMIPALFFSSFVVDMQGVMQDTTRNILIPGWGFISSIVNNPSFGVRVAMFLYTIIVAIVLAIIAFATKFLLKIVNGDRFMFIMYCILAIFQFCMAINIIYFRDAILEFGIERGIWFGIVSVIVVVLLGAFYWEIGNMMQSNDDL